MATRRLKQNEERRRAVHTPALGRKRVSVVLEPASPQRVRIAGTLAELVPEEGLFSLVTAEGESLRGIAPSVPAETLRVLLGRRVLIAGTAFFSRSGSLLEVEADDVQAAEGDVSFWSSLPRPVLGGIEGRDIPGLRERPSGLGTVVGQWPGDESEEEILALLEEMS